MRRLLPLLLGIVVLIGAAGQVRQAMNHAVNWEQILETIYRGYGTRLATVFLPSGFGFDDGLKPYPYDPAKVRALLERAGYTVKNN